METSEDRDELAIVWSCRQWLQQWPQFELTSSNAQNLRLHYYGIRVWLRLSEVLHIEKVLGSYWFIKLGLDLVDTAPWCPRGTE